MTQINIGGFKMYNLDELTVEDLTRMKRYIGQLNFLLDESSMQLYTYLKSINEGEAVINQINLHEIKTIFSEALFKEAQERHMLIDFYADINENGELYNIKELTVYDRYLPSY